MSGNTIEKLAAALPFKLSSRELLLESDLDDDEAKRIIAEGFKAVAIEEIMKSTGHRLSAEASLSRFLQPMAEKFGLGDAKFEIEINHIQDRVGFRLRLYKVF